MAKQMGPVIEMTADGNFIEKPKPTLGQIAARLALFGVAIGAAAVAFWTMLFVLPILLIVGAAGYFLLRGQLRRQGGTISRTYGR